MQNADASDPRSERMYSKYTTDSKAAVRCSNGNLGTSRFRAKPRKDYSTCSCVRKGSAWHTSLSRKGLRDSYAGERSESQRQKGPRATKFNVRKRDSSVQRMPDMMSHLPCHFRHHIRHHIRYVDPTCGAVAAKYKQNQLLAASESRGVNPDICPQP